MTLSKFYYDIDPSTTDLLTAINGVSITLTSITNLTNQWAQWFWTENNVNGQSCLCVIKLLETPLTLTMTDGTNPPYDITPIPFVVVETCGEPASIFGPNPHNAKPGPRK